MSTDDQIGAKHKRTDIINDERERELYLQRSAGCRRTHAESAAGPWQQENGVPGDEGALYTAACDVIAVERRRRKRCGEGVDWWENMSMGKIIRHLSELLENFSNCFWNWFCFVFVFLPLIKRV